MASYTQEETTINITKFDAELWAEFKGEATKQRVLLRYAVRDALKMWLHAAENGQLMDWGSQQELEANCFGEVWELMAAGVRMPKKYLEIMDKAVSWEHARDLLKEYDD
jgi:hypothetical protein